MNRLYTDKIVVHHSVTPQSWGKDQTVELITRSHKERGLAYDGNPAYHVIIGKDWQVLARPEASVGYHSGSWFTNRTSVAVCLVGNFNVDELTAYQSEKLANQLRNWQKQYNIKRERIYLHRQIKATACPGLNINQDVITKLLANNRYMVEVEVVKFLFEQIWHRKPAKGDWRTFYLRCLKATGAEQILDRDNLINTMKYWYSIVYPNGTYSKEGDRKWQDHKEAIQRKYG